MISVRSVSRSHRRARGRNTERQANLFMVFPSVVLSSSCRRVWAVGAVCMLSMAVAIGSGATALAAESAIGLGTAAEYAVLAGATVTNTGPSQISGSVGVHEGSAVVGFPPGIITNGVIHAADVQAAQAKIDLTAAYDDAAGRPSSAAASADLVGQTLVSGVYTGPTLGLTGELTLDAQGDPNAVWIFQAASTLITASDSTVLLVNGAQACNVFWQVGSSVTLGSNSNFVGTVMALTSIAAQTGARIEGRVLARNGEVTLDNNVITAPACQPPVETSSSTTSPTSTTGSTVSSPTGGGGLTPGSPSPPDGDGARKGITAVSSESSMTIEQGTTGEQSTTGGPSTPAGPGTGTGQGSGIDTNKLAVTGPDVGLPLTVGVLFIIAGSLLITIARRGPRRHGSHRQAG